ncbi:MAG: transglutaminase family protein [Acidimicrobiales bacterium]
MKYRVVHRTTYRYARPVSLGYTLARLTPRTFPGQVCHDSLTAIDPTPDHRSGRTDWFGNEVTWFSIERPHASLEVTATSEVTVEGEPVALLNASTQRWEEVRDTLRHSDAPDVLAARPFVLPSTLIGPTEGIDEFTDASFRPDRPLVDAVIDLMGRIFREFAYDPGFTTVSTPLVDVLEHRRGVCQDFAHLAIAALRSRGLAARYVSGYLETRPPPGVEKLQGADASHAWFAVFVPGVGWIDLDPTNDQAVGERHITVGWGRDYRDVAPVVGVLYAGGAGQELDVGVDVVPLA